MMMNTFRNLVAMALLMGAMNPFVSAQQFMSRNASISFFSSTPVEDISAESDQGSAVLDVADSRLAFQVPILSFHFEKALMEEHFNENYMESEQFPAATFQGKIEGLSVDGAEGQVQQVAANGQLTIHGVTVDRRVEGTATRTKDGWTLHATFGVPTADHNIAIPKLVRAKIAEEIEVTLDATLLPR